MGVTRVPSSAGEVVAAETPVETRQSPGAFAPEPQRPGEPSRNVDLGQVGAGPPTTLQGPQPPAPLLQPSPRSDGAPPPLSARAQDAWDALQNDDEAPLVSLLRAAEDPEERLAIFNRLLTLAGDAGADALAVAVGALDLGIPASRSGAAEHPDTAPVDLRAEFAQARAEMAEPGDASRHRRLDREMRALWANPGTHRVLQRYDITPQAMDEWRRTGIAPLRYAELIADYEHSGRAGLYNAAIGLALLERNIQRYRVATGDLPRGPRAHAALEVSRHHINRVSTQWLVRNEVQANRLDNAAQRARAHVEALRSQHASASVIAEAEGSARNADVLALQVRNRMTGIYQRQVDRNGGQHAPRAMRERLRDSAFGEAGITLDQAENADASIDIAPKILSATTLVARGRSAVDTGSTQSINGARTASGLLDRATRASQRNAAAHASATNTRQAVRTRVALADALAQDRDAIEQQVASRRLSATQASDTLRAIANRESEIRQQDEHDAQRALLARQRRANDVSFVYTFETGGRRRLEQDLARLQATVREMYAQQPRVPGILQAEIERNAAQQRLDEATSRYRALRSRPAETTLDDAAGQALVGHDHPTDEELEGERDGARYAAREANAYADRHLPEGRTSSQVVQQAAANAHYLEGDARSAELDQALQQAIAEGRRIDARGDAALERAAAQSTAPLLAAAVLRARTSRDEQLVATDQAMAALRSEAAESSIPASVLQRDGELTRDLQLGAALATAANGNTWATRTRLNDAEEAFALSASRDRAGHNARMQQTGVEAVRTARAAIEHDATTAGQQGSGLAALRDTVAQINTRIGSDAAVTARYQSDDADYDIEALAAVAAREIAEAGQMAQTDASLALQQHFHLWTQNGGLLVGNLFGRLSRAVDGADLTTADVNAIQGATREAVAQVSWVAAGVRAMDANTRARYMAVIRAPGSDEEREQALSALLGDAAQARRHLQVWAGTQTFQAYARGPERDARRVAADTRAAMDGHRWQPRPPDAVAQVVHHRTHEVETDQTYFNNPLNRWGAQLVDEALLFVATGGAGNIATAGEGAVEAGRFLTFLRRSGTFVRVENGVVRAGRFASRFNYGVRTESWMMRNGHTLSGYVVRYGRNAAHAAVMQYGPQIAHHYAAQRFGEDSWVTGMLDATTRVGIYRMGGPVRGFTALENGATGLAQTVIGDTAVAALTRWRNPGLSGPALDAAMERDRRLYDMIFMLAQTGVGVARMRHGAAHQATETAVMLHTGDGDAPPALRNELRQYYEALQSGSLRPEEHHQRMARIVTLAGDDAQARARVQQVMHAEILSHAQRVAELDRIDWAHPPSRETVGPAIERMAQDIALSGVADHDTSLGMARSAITGQALDALSRTYGVTPEAITSDAMSAETLQRRLRQVAEALVARGLATDPGQAHLLAREHLLGLVQRHTTEHGALGATQLQRINEVAERAVIDGYCLAATPEVSVAHRLSAVAWQELSGQRARPPALAQVVREILGDATVTNDVLVQLAQHRQLSAPDAPTGTRAARDALVSALARMGMSDDEARARATTVYADEVASRYSDALPEPGQGLRSAVAQAVTAMEAHQPLGAEHLAELHSRLQASLRAAGVSQRVAAEIAQSEVVRYACEIANASSGYDGRSVATPEQGRSVLQAVQTLLARSPLTPEQQGVALGEVRAQMLTYVASAHIGETPTPVAQRRALEQAARELALPPRVASELVNLSLASSIMRRLLAQGGDETAIRQQLLDALLLSVPAAERQGRREEIEAFVNQRRASETSVLERAEPPTPAPGDGAPEASADTDPFAGSTVRRDALTSLFEESDRVPAVSTMFQQVSRSLPAEARGLLAPVEADLHQFVERQPPEHRGSISDTIRFALAAMLQQHGPTLTRDQAMHTMDALTQAFAAYTRLGVASPSVFSHLFAVANRDAAEVRPLFDALRAVLPDGAPSRPALGALVADVLTRNLRAEEAAGLIPLLGGLTDAQSRALLSAMPAIEGAYFPRNGHPSEALIYFATRLCDSSTANETRDTLGALLALRSTLVTRHLQLRPEGIAALAVAYAGAIHRGQAPARAMNTALDSLVPAHLSADLLTPAVLTRLDGERLRQAGEGMLAALESRPSHVDARELHAAVRFAPELVPLLTPVFRGAADSLRSHDVDSAASVFQHMNAGDRVFVAQQLEAVADPQVRALVLRAFVREYLTGPVGSEGRGYQVARATARMIEVQRALENPASRADTLRAMQNAPLMLERAIASGVAELPNLMASPFASGMTTPSTAERLPAESLPAAEQALRRAMWREGNRMRAEVRGFLRGQDNPHQTVERWVSAQLSRPEMPPWLRQLDSASRQRLVDAGVQAFESVVFSDHGQLTVRTAEGPTIGPEVIVPRGYAPALLRQRMAMLRAMSEAVVRDALARGEPNPFARERQVIVLEPPGASQLSDYTAFTAEASGVAYTDMNVGNAPVRMTFSNATSSTLVHEFGGHVLDFMGALRDPLSGRTVREMAEERARTMRRTDAPSGYAQGDVREYIAEAAAEYFGVLGDHPSDMNALRTRDPSMFRALDRTFAETRVRADDQARYFRNISSIAVSVGVAPTPPPDAARALISTASARFGPAWGAVAGWHAYNLAQRALAAEARGHSGEATRLRAERTLMDALIAGEGGAWNQTALRLVLADRHQFAPGARDRVQRMLAAVREGDLTSLAAIRSEVMQPRMPPRQNASEPALRESRERYDTALTALGNEALALRAYDAIETASPDARAAFMRMLQLGGESARMGALALDLLPVAQHGLLVLAMQQPNPAAQLQSILRDWGNGCAPWAGNWLVYQAARAGLTPAGMRRLEVLSNTIAHYPQVAVSVARILENPAFTEAHLTALERDLVLARGFPPDAAAQHRLALVSQLSTQPAQRSAPALLLMTLHAQGTEEVTRLLALPEAETAMWTSLHETMRDRLGSDALAGQFLTDYLQAVLARSDPSRASAADARLGLLNLIAQQPAALAPRALRLAQRSYEGETAVLGALRSSNPELAIGRLERPGDLASARQARREARESARVDMGLSWARGQVRVPELVLRRVRLAIEHSDVAAVSGVAALPPVAATTEVAAAGPSPQPDAVESVRVFTPPTVDWGARLLARGLRGEAHTELVRALSDLSTRRDLSVFAYAEQVRVLLFRARIGGGDAHGVVDAEVLHALRSATGGQTPEQVRDVLRGWGYALDVATAMSTECLLPWPPRDGSPSPITASQAAVLASQASLRGFGALAAPLVRALDAQAAVELSGHATGADAEANAQARVHARSATRYARAVADLQALPPATVSVLNQTPELAASLLLEVASLSQGLRRERLLAFAALPEPLRRTLDTDADGRGLAPIVAYASARSPDPATMQRFVEGARAVLQAAGTEGRDDVLRALSHLSTNVAMRDWLAALQTGARETPGARPRELRPVTERLQGASARDAVLEARIEAQRLSEVHDAALEADVAARLRRIPVTIEGFGRRQVNDAGVVLAEYDVEVPGAMFEVTGGELGAEKETQLIERYIPNARGRTIIVMAPNAEALPERVLHAAREANVQIVLARSVDQAVNRYEVHARDGGQTPLPQLSSSEYAAPLTPGSVAASLLRNDRLRQQMDVDLFTLRQPAAAADGMQRGGGTATRPAFAGQSPAGTARRHVSSQPVSAEHMLRGLYHQLQRAEPALADGLLRLLQADFAGTSADFTRRQRARAMAALLVAQTVEQARTIVAHWSRQAGPPLQAQLGVGPEQAAAAGDALRRLASQREHVPALRQDLDRYMGALREALLTATRPRDAETPVALAVRERAIDDYLLLVRGREQAPPARLRHRLALSGDPAVLRGTAGSPATTQMWPNGLAPFALSTAGELFVAQNRGEVTGSHAFFGSDAVTAQGMMHVHDGVIGRVVVQQRMQPAQQTEFLRQLRATGADLSRATIVINGVRVELSR